MKEHIARVSFRMFGSWRTLTTISNLAARRKATAGFSPKVDCCVKGAFLYGFRASVSAVMDAIFDVDKYVERYS